MEPGSPSSPPPAAKKDVKHRKRSPSAKRGELHKSKAGDRDRHAKAKENKEEISDAKPAVAKEKRERENMDAKEAVGDYILVKMLGKGAFGVVYKAIHRHRGNTVAIKQLNMKKASEEDMRNLKMEINLLQSLNHPNIVQYIDQLVSPKSQQLNIVMEYIENGSLATMVADWGRFPETLCKTYIAQTLKGLAYLHQQGVIHRDIKGGNLLITRDGEVKLADFGVSTKLQAATEGGNSGVSDDEDETKIPAGTPYYMAPEVIQFLGAKPQSDVWSLGCTIIELLTGEPPYFKLDPFSAMYRMVQDDYPPIPSGISPALMDFLMQCFNKDHNMRISTQGLLSHSWVKEAAKIDERPSRNVDSVKLALEQYKEAFAEVEDQIRKYGTVAEPETEKMKSNSTFQKMSGYFTAKDTFREQMEEGRRLVEESKAKQAASKPTQPPLQLKPPAQQQPLKLAIKPAAAFVEDDDEAWDDDLDVQPIKLSLPGAAPKQTAPSKPAAPLVLKVGQPQQTPAKPSAAAAPGRRPTVSASDFDDAVLRPVVNLNKFKEEGDEFDDIDEFGSDSFGALQLGEVLKKKQEVAWNKWDDDDDLLGVEEQDQKAILQEKVQEALFSEVLDLFSKLRPDFKDEVAAQKACIKLMEIFNRHPDMLTKLARKSSLLPLMLTLESASHRVVSSVLQLLVQMINNDSVLSHLCIMGLIPVIMNWAHHSHPLEVRIQAATLIYRIVSSNVQMFIACRGLPILVDLLEPEQYAKSAKTVQLSIDSITSIFDHLQQTPIPKNEVDRLFVHSGLLDKLALTLIAL